MVKLRLKYKEILTVISQDSEIHFLILLPAICQLWLTGDDVKLRPLSCYYLLSWDDVKLRPLWHCFCLELAINDSITC